MNMKSRTSSALLIASSLVAISATLPTYASDQFEIFWRELQRTDGASVSQTNLPRETSALKSGDKSAMATHEWFEAERRKTDGYRDENGAATSPATGMVGRREAPDFRDPS